MKTIVGIFILALAIAAEGASLSPRIVGGSLAPADKYPYQVALWFRQHKFYCGGSILNERYILTAAHCLKGHTADEFSVLVGSNSLIEGGKRYAAEKLVVHEEYERYPVKNDIALIRLREKIIFSDVAQPIAVPDVEFTTAGSPAVLTGWGRLSAHANGPKYLQEIELRICNHTLCSDLLNVSSKEICTLTEIGEGACFGDSGGPLVANGFVIGVVSWGIPCARGVPDVFTRVHSYRDWISENMDDLD